MEVIRYPDCDKWFRVKVSFRRLTPTRAPKRKPPALLISASDVRDAYDKVAGHMNKLGVGYVIPSVAFQKIVEVFPQEEWQVVDGQERPKEDLVEAS